MPVIVTEETPAQIKEMGAIGKLVENCTDCKKPTRYWANDGEYPLCPTCARKR
jgi:predicted amidophosphoribosyltransferase